MNTQTRTSVWACTWCILKIATCSASQHSRAYRFRSFLKFQHIPASVSFSVVLDIFKFFCLKHDFKLVSCTVLWYKSYKTLSVIRSARYVHGILFVRPSSCMWTLFSWTLRKISYHPHLECWICFLSLIKSYNHKICIVNLPSIDYNLVIEGVIRAIQHLFIT